MTGPSRNQGAARHRRGILRLHEAPPVRLAQGGCPHGQHHVSRAGGIDQEAHRPQQPGHRHAWTRTRRAQAGREDIAVRLAKFCFVKTHVFDKPDTEPEHLSGPELWRNSPERGDMQRCNNELTSGPEET